MDPAVDLCQIPAGPSPNGRSNFENPASLAPAMMSVMGILVAWGIAFTATRFYINVRKLGWADCAFLPPLSPSTFHPMSGIFDPNLSDIIPNRATRLESGFSLLCYSHLRISSYSLVHCHPQNFDGKWSLTKLIAFYTQSLIWHVTFGMSQRAFSMALMHR